MEYQTQNVREIQKRIRLLEKAERDLDALFRKERLVIAALESQRNSSMHRSTKDVSQLTTPVQHRPGLA
jgi:hypothetical protein